MFARQSFAQGHQQQEFHFIWGEPNIIFDADSVARKVINLHGASYNTENNYLPEIQTMILITSPLDSVSIDSVACEDFSDEEIKLLNQTISSNLQVISTKELHSRNKDYLNIDIIPVESKPGSNFKKITYLKLGLHFSLNKKNLSARRQSSTFNSVLASGDWYKIGVTEDGIYKIDYQYLQKIGINPGTLDPKTIRIFGNGCHMLPQPNSVPRAVDLTENAILVQGENDGHFDATDYILFYGQSPDTHYFDASTGRLIYDKNLYSDTTYYFLNIGETKGLRIATADNAGDDFQMVSSYDYFTTHELDEVNILNSGRYWYGEKFDFELSHDFNVQIPNLLPETEIGVVSSIMAETYQSASMDLSLNGNNLGNQELKPVFQGTYSQQGTDNLDSFKINSSNVLNAANSYTLSLNFNKAAGDRSRAYLNYFEVTAKCGLTLTNNQIIFTSLSSTEQPFTTYQIAGVNQNAMIWDVSNPLEPVNQNFDNIGEKAIFGTSSSTLKTFVVSNGTDYPAPAFFHRVKNQNLHGEQAPDLLIVTYPGFLTEAQRLANLRRQHDGLDVLVVTTREIYNEFSSGAQDITAIRDFVRFLYDQSADNHKLRDLLMFGRGSFDYKDRLSQNTNFVPTYCSRNSLHPISSYSSDDYFGFLDEDEGEWSESGSGDEMLDIGVGRLPVKSLAEAKIVVDKLYNYAENPETLGSWRNEICFIADDGDDQDGTLHERDADKLATLVDTAYTGFNVNKIYIDAYPQIISPIGETAPEANEAIDKKIDKGLLIMNYTGHGSETRLASETVINITSISKLENYQKLPLFVTATCEFGRHDDPKIVSGAEYLLLNPRGGAIGLLTTSRPVYSSSNYVLNEAFYQNVFRKDNGQYQDLGAVFMATKNESLSGSVNRNFILLGDPSMKLAYPKQDIRIVASENSYAPGDTLKALNQIKLTGEILTDSKSVDEGFNGDLYATIFDKASTKSTLGNRTPVMQYKSRDNAIFQGIVTVKNGTFEVNFVVPKNISYNFDKGKISLYAINKTNLNDANGADLEFVVGGSGKSTVDNSPPKIKLYINDTTFSNGGITGKDIIFLAKLEDENGINLSKQGFGQGIMATLDNDQKFELNDYYLSEPDSYQAGWVTYPIKNLSIGNHTISLKAWDTHNNSSESTIEFLVVDHNHLKISNLINYPNPFTDQTRISFEQNRAGDDLEIIAEIYTIQGAKISILHLVEKNSDSKISNIVWDGRDQVGVSLNSGIYILKLFVRSLLDGAKITANKKLVLIK